MSVRPSLLPSPPVTLTGAAPPAGWPAGLALVALLTAAGLGFAFRGGSYFPAAWLPLGLAVAAVAAVVFAVGPVPTLDRGQLALLGGFSLLALWTALSVTWAGSHARAGLEAERTAVYYLGFILAVVAVSWAGSRGALWLAEVVLAGIVVVAGADVVRLALAGDPSVLFTSGRLQYPVTYWNGLAALLMTGTWLAMGLAQARPRRTWLQPLLLGIALLLTELAVLPESRGALWTFLLVAPLFVVLAPHRFRGLVNLALLTGGVALAWPKLTAVYRPAQAAANTGAIAGLESALTGALLWAGISLAVVLIVWLLTYLLERRLAPLSPVWVRRVGIVLLVLAVLAAGAGLAVFSAARGDPLTAADRVWHRMTADVGAESGAGSRFGEVSLNGRWQQWSIAWRALAERPFEGLGIGNYQAYFYQHRTSGLQVTEAHSRPMEVLAEVGAPGMLLWLALLLGALARGVWLRLRAGRPENQAVAAALALGVLSWSIHSSADWFWQIAGVSWPVVLLLGGLVGAGGGRRSPGEAERRSWGVALRVGGVVVALAVLVGAALPLLSLRYLDLARAADDPATVSRALDLAASFDRFSAEPFAMRARFAATAAAAAREQGGPDAPIAAREDFALAILAWDEALQREPSDWTLRYACAQALLDLRDAPRGTAGTSTPGLVAASGRSDALREILARPDAVLTEQARKELEEVRRLNPRGHEAAAGYKRLSGR